MPEAAEAAQRERPAKPFPVRRPVQAKTGFFDKFVLGGLIVGALVMAFDYMLVGAQGTGLLWFRAREYSLDFVTWRADVYLIILLPGMIVMGWLARHFLPIIEIPVLGGSEKEATWTKVWYRPGSINIEGDNLVWREGARRAMVNKSLIAKKGMFLGYAITAPVERNINDVERLITYDTTAIETYRSQTLNHRLKMEIQQRVVQEMKMGGLQ